MAGNYPSPTAKRVNYPLDGTRVWYKTANAASTPLVEDSSFSSNMNDESSGTTPVLTLAWSSTTNPGHGPFILFKFPRAVDISGIKGWLGFDGAVTVHASNDTTNGVDGTWTAGNSYTPAKTGSQREWSRTGAITNQTLNGFRWLRLTLPSGSTGNRGVGKVLIYGSPTAATDTLDFWHPTLNQTATPDLLEFGDRPRGTSVTKTFRVKNLSTSMKASGVSITRVITSDTSPSVPSFHTFSLDNISWVGSLSLGDLTPGQVSPVIYVKQDVPVNATLWLWQIAVVATPSTWGP